MATRASPLVLTVPTPVGPAEVVLERWSARASSLLVLGHGAGGDIEAADLVAVRDAALASRVAVARVTQPYRVAGRRAPAPATALDRAWVAAVEEIRGQVGARVPVVLGGRSSGARVACRTARGLGAAGVLALAYPLHPPGKPGVTRVGELDPTIPTLVINGDRDPFGVPVSDGLIEVVVRPGEAHDLRRDPAAVAAVAISWLHEHGWAL
jgi:predicted alpha/beta-hydrolase family hydrolase